MDPIVVNLLREQADEVDEGGDDVRTRRGKTDWTMDLPKLNYDDDSDEETGNPKIRGGSKHSSLADREDTLIRVEDIALSDEEPKPKKAKETKSKHFANEQDSDDEDEDESITELEKKYLAAAA